jgi:hypothetical protein
MDVIHIRTLSPGLQKNAATVAFCRDALLWFFKLCVIFILQTLLSAANLHVLFWGLLANAPSTTFVVLAVADVRGPKLLGL